jgi:hypothetical protein
MNELHWTFQIILAVASLLCIAAVCLLHLSDPNARGLYWRWGVASDVAAVIGWFIIYSWGLYALFWFIPSSWGSGDSDEFRPVRLTVSVFLAFPLALKSWSTMASREELEREIGLLKSWPTSASREEMEQEIRELKNEIRDLKKENESLISENRLLDNDGYQDHSENIRLKEKISELETVISKLRDSDPLQHNLFE